MRAWASRQNKAPNSKPSAEESLGKGNLGGTSKILLLHELSAQAWHAKGFLNPSLYYYSSYHWEEWDLCRTQLFVHLRQSFYYSPCSHASQVQEAKREILLKDTCHETEQCEPFSNMYFVWYLQPARGIHSYTPSQQVKTLGHREAAHISKTHTATTAVTQMLSTAFFHCILNPQTAFKQGEEPQERQRGRIENPKQNSRGNPDT